MPEKSGESAHEESAHEESADQERTGEQHTGNEVAPFAFPDVRRRMIGSAYLLLVGTGLIAGAFIWSPPAYNAGFPVAGGAIAILGLYFASAAWRLRVSESVAIETAAAQFGFAMGPASVSIGWRGVRSRPVWRILAYSHEAPPKMRGLALIDAVDGSVLSKIEEENPEDWSEDAEDAGEETAGSKQ